MLKLPCNQLDVGKVVCVERRFTPKFLRKMPSIGKSIYYHFGVVVGKNQIVHFSGDILKRVKLRLSSFQEFHSSFLSGLPIFEPATLSSDIEVYFHFPYRHSLEKIAERAIQRFEQARFRPYDLESNNCEHFASWCITGVEISYQADWWLENYPIGFRALCAALSFSGLVK
ncbi:MAG TPA: lecithin retinol acyltransferase family protein [Candidatus Rifleibacterium sp.]|nr:lecithin retinol acyltransferase family protein [Candidatus Rifleibacterium sp.]HPT47931.1 lecithin retinol acyltransferase family protein [Candidatus Rifleibacterium sp.]